jgi:hypothetical protein
LPHPRYAFSVVALDNIPVILGGLDQKGKKLNSILAWDWEDWKSLKPSFKLQELTFLRLLLIKGLAQLVSMRRNKNYVKKNSSGINLDHN